MAKWQEPAFDKGFYYFWGGKKWQISGKLPANQSKNGKKVETCKNLNPVWSLGLESERWDLLEGLSLLVRASGRCGRQGLVREHEHVVQLHEIRDFGLLVAGVQLVEHLLEVVAEELLVELLVGEAGLDESTENVDLDALGRDEHERPDDKMHGHLNDGEDELLHVGSFRSGSLYDVLNSRKKRRAVQAAPLFFLDDHHQQSDERSPQERVEEDHETT